MSAPNSSGSRSLPTSVAVWLCRCSFAAKRLCSAPEPRRDIGIVLDNACRAISVATVSDRSLLTSTTIDSRRDGAGWFACVRSGSRYRVNNAAVSWRVNSTTAGSIPNSISLFASPCPKMTSNSLSNSLMSSGNWLIVSVRSSAHSGGVDCSTNQWMSTGPFRHSISVPKARVASQPTG